MTMSTLFSIISVIGGLGLSMTATALLAAALFPGWVARARQRVTRMPVRTFLVGLLVGTFFMVIGSAMISAGGPVGFFGGIVVAGTLGFALAGSAGVAMSIGAGLPSAADVERPWQAIIRGWVVLFLASLMPILGWFVLLPIALLMGFGAAVLGLFGRSAPRVPEQQRSFIEITDEEVVASELVESVDESPVASGVGAER
ncbi:MAG: hypothetical protein QGG71_01605 [Pirellulaceae bacterium]|jgi:hypothetical protein|nr:hypothetical protein [Planctomycetaceae bacterium]MDP6553328.1 hypothetical protein [Pirellulaceae bacterium]